jgi:hypothetical protein
MLSFGAAARPAQGHQPDVHAPSVFTRGAGWWLVGIASIYYLTYFNYGIDLDDEGYLLLNAASILHGQWPVADFFSYEPLSYFLLALFFKVFGNSVLTERLLLVGLILINIKLIHYCATKVIPPAWAWMPAAVYAFAPGPWYKVFFISHSLLSLAALLYFLERPGLTRTVLLGLTAGLAAVSRKEAGAVILILIGGFLAIFSGDSDRGDGGPRTTNPLGRLLAVFGREAAFFLGFSMPIAIVLAGYAGAGKLPVLLHNLDRYYNEFNYIGYENAIPGVATVFGVSRLFASPSLEMQVYALGMLACLFNVTRHGLAILAPRPVSKEALAGFAIAIFGVGSMGYTYHYVWNSRMLSSFAIVYLNYFAVLFFAQQKLGPAGARARVITVAAGVLAVLFYLKSFIVVQNYSGSYTTNVRGAMATVNAPALQGIHVYAGQVDDIERMLSRTQRAPRGSFLVPMSESTTMAYIAGLPNPTYYRLFITEFAPPGERERAIETFERYRIRYFVARRSQFLEGGGYSSNLDAYAPQIKAYLLSKYQVIPLGNQFVLLQRK